MNENTRLVAGPWVGEFGWELFAWQAHLRALSRKYSETVVICRPSAKDLYSDFASGFLFHSPTGGPADQWFRLGYDLNKNINQLIAENTEVFTSRPLDYLTPRQIGIPNNGVTHFSEKVQVGNTHVVPEYIKFTGATTHKFDIVFHARSREIRKQDNWSDKEWSSLAEKFISEGKTVCCIGTKKESLIVPGCTDMRECDMNTLFGILGASRGVFGPSSGPMHLASLCGAPHVVWSESKNHKRYTSTWNPLNAPVLFLDEFGWHPDPEYIYSKYSNWIKE
jgi:hypothetical protein